MYCIWKTFLTGIKWSFFYLLKTKQNNIIVFKRSIFVSNLFQSVGGRSIIIKETYFMQHCITNSFLNVVAIFFFHMKLLLAGTELCEIIINRYAMLEALILFMRRENEYHIDCC